jgi:hypothetical protein
MDRRKTDRRLRAIEKKIDRTLRDHWREALSPAYLERKREGDHYTFGACYAASEAFLHLARREGIELVPQVGRVRGMTHWWLRDEAGGRIIDPTAAQFKSAALRERFYKAGRGCGFLTRQPSRRAQALLRHIR